ncbi:DUF1127 domain-containing protein [Pararhodobacter sp. SW119]|uniref:DUF1127 domain-containing protein n=1 Tax=Pararhodobacter sp. SW119 TaxID=2780075 RepID=UPI001AE04504|nr:DUF1127 domain-containing protein [Pararhodobacter sp. SW119]
MAVLAQTRPIALGGGFSFAGLFTAFSAWNDRRITRRELAKLSDRELEDIGLCRADIDTVIDQIR